MSDDPGNVLKGHAEKMDKMSGRSAELRRSLDATREEYESGLDKLLSEKEAKERVKSGKKADLSKLKALDAAIEEGKTYQTDMQHLIEELTSELENLGRKVATSKDYQGLEKVWAAVGAERWANTSRLERIRSQNVAGSMQTVLTYAHGTIESLNQQIAKNAEIYAALTAKEKLITQKMNENQPKYEKFRAEVASLQTELKEIERKLREANETDRPALEAERTAKQRDLDQARLNETSYFEIVRNASEAIDLVRHHAEAFYQAISALTQSKIKTAEKVENLKEIFTGIYQIMETALEIKGFSRIDSTLNYLADKTTETLNIQIEGILDETRARSEKKVIDEAKMTQYMEHLGHVIEDFTKGMKAQQDKYARKD